MLGLGVKVEVAVAGGWVEVAVPLGAALGVCVTVGVVVPDVGVAVRVPSVAVTEPVEVAVAVPPVGVDVPVACGVGVVLGPGLPVGVGLTAGVTVAQLPVSRQTALHTAIHCGGHAPHTGGWHVKALPSSHWQQMIPSEDCDNGLAATKTSVE